MSEMGEVVKMRKVGVDDADERVNLAVVRGECSGPPETRTLESGARVASLAVRCPTGGAGERATSVPVTVWDPPAWIETLDRGDEVVVVGRVRRRFFGRPGGVERFPSRPRRRRDRPGA